METPHVHPRPTATDYPTLSSQPLSNRTDNYDPISYNRDAYDEPSSKRQRMSIDVPRRIAYEQEQPVAQRSHTLSNRDTFSQYPTRETAAISRGSYYNQGTSSISGSNGSEYTFGHQRTNSSTISSPYTSPNGEYHNYPSSTPSSSYQQQARENAYQYSAQYPHSQYQSRPTTSLSQPTNYYRTLPSSMPSQPEQSRSYSTTSQVEQPRPYIRSYDADDQSMFDRGYNPSLSIPRGDLFNSQPQSLSSTYERSSQSLARTLPDPSQAFSSVLPPLQSTLPSNQPRRDLSSSYPYGGLSNMESQNPGQGP